MPEIPSRSEEPAFGDTPEFRDPKAEKIVTLLEKLQLEDVLSNEHTKKEFLRNLDFTAFRDFLIRINGISRGISMKERGIDGKDVVLDAGPWGVQATPEFEDKEELLKEIYEQAQKIEDTKDSALLLGASIGAIHPFADGNGRTSRLIFALLHDGYSGSAEDKEKLTRLLGAEGRQTVDISSAYIRRQVNERQAENAALGQFENPTLTEFQDIRNIEFPSGIPAEKQEGFIRMIEDGHQDYARLAIYEYFLSHNKVDEQHFQTVPDNSHHIQGDDGELYPDPDHLTKEVMPLRTIISELTETDIDEILESNKQAKKEYIRLLADTIAHPEKYPYPDESGFDKFTNLKEYYMHRIASRHREYFKKAQSNKT